MTNAKFWGRYLNNLMIEDGADPIEDGDSAETCLRKIVNYVELLREEITELGDGVIEFELLDDEE